MWLGMGMASDGPGFLVILNKSSELRFGLRRSELIFRTWARPVQFVDCRVRTRWLGQWVDSWRWTNSQLRKIVSLSPRVGKPKLKEGNKSFVPEPRESSVFRVFFGFLYVWRFYEHYERLTHPYICIWIFWPYATINTACKQIKSAIHRNMRNRTLFWSQ